jgi:hypothetical protein
MSDLAVQWNLIEEMENREITVLLVHPVSAPLQEHVESYRIDENGHQIGC